MLSESQPAPPRVLHLHTSINAPLLKYLTERRSVSANSLKDPGPDREVLATMLQIAARVPDHKKLAPWRFIVFQGDSRSKFGELLAQRWAERESGAAPARLDLERDRFTRAPLVVAVIASPKPHPAAPEWEQILSAGCVCFNLMNAAFAHGFAANWITEWYAYDEGVHTALGLGETEKIAGFVYVGSPDTKPEDRERPDIAAITQYWP